MDLIADTKDSQAFVECGDRVVTSPLSLGRDCRCCNVSCRNVGLDCWQQLLVVSGDVARHIFCTNGNHDLLDLGIAGACNKRVCVCVRKRVKLR